MGIKMSIWGSIEKSLILCPAAEVQKSLFGLLAAPRNFGKCTLQPKYFTIRNIGQAKFCFSGLFFPRSGYCWVSFKKSKVCVHGYVLLRLKKGKFKKSNLTVFNHLHASFYSTHELWLEAKTTQKDAAYKMFIRSFFFFFFLQTCCNCGWLIVICLDVICTTQSTTCQNKVRIST